MKYILLSIAVIIIGLSNLAAQTVQWQHSIGGVSIDYATAVAKDNNGNVYVTGTAKETAYFNDTCANCSVTGEVMGNGNSYLVKYDAQGNYRWSKLLYNDHTTFHGPRKIHLIGNRIHVVFPYFDSIVLDPDVNPVVINTPGKSAIIHIELDMNGNYLAHREILPKSNITGSDYWFINDVDFDNNGNLFIAGGFGDTLSINGVLYGTPQKFSDCIFKIEPTNQITWFYDNMSVLSISVDNQNHLYAGVNFADSISLILNSTPSTFYTPDTPNPNLADGLLIRISPLGNIVSAKHISGKKSQYISHVACYGSTVTIAGTFFDTLLYVPNATTLTCYGQWHDLFIMQFQNDTLLWKNQLYSTAVVQATDIAYTPAGSAFVSGIFSDSLLADYKNTQILKFSGGGTPAIFTVKYSYGQFGFLEQFHTLSSLDFMLGPRLSFIDENDFYMIASYEGQMPVNFTGNPAHIQSRGGIDGYIAKYNTYATTGVPNIIAEAAVTIYPNPSANRLNIIADNQISALSVFDYTGRRLYSSNPKNNKCVIDITLWANGVYIVEVNTDGALTRHKFVVSH